MRKMMKGGMLLTASLLVGAAVSAQSIPEIKKSMDAERYLKAKIMAAQLVAGKGDPANYFYLGKAYLGLDQPDSAKIAFDKGVSTDGNFALNYVGLGMLELRAGHPDAAASIFEKAVGLVAKKKDDPTLLEIGKAYTYTAKPDFKAALVYLQRARDLDPKNAEVLLVQGDANRGLKKNTEAYDLYNAAFAMDNSLLRAKISLGMILKQATAYQESIEAFNKVLATDPNYAPAYRELAETYYFWASNIPTVYTEKVRTALEYYRKYVDLTDRSLESRMRYADFLILAKDYKTLEQEAQQMAKDEKSNKRILRYLGYSAYENKNFEASANALSDFIASVDSSRIIALDYLYLGKAQVETGKLADAVTNFEKAIAKDPSIGAEMGTIGKALYTAKNYHGAALLYGLAVQNPESKTFAYDNFYLGMSHYFDFGEQVRLSTDATQNPKVVPDSTILVKADSAFSKVIALSPTTADAYLFRARTRKLMDREEDMKGLMVPDYEKYVDLVTANADFATNARAKTTVIEAYSNLGAFSAKTDKKEAQEYFNAIIKIDPKNEYATSSLKLLGNN